MSKSELQEGSRSTYPKSHENIFVGNDIFGLYRHDVKQYTLLDSEEMQDLVDRVQAGKAAREELKADDIAAERVQELNLLVQQGVDARNRILLGNTGLAFAPARRRAGFGLEELDLLQEANIAIIKAAETYNPKKGLFSSHATTRIRAELADAVSDQGRMIRIPNYHSMKLQQMRIKKNEYENINKPLSDETLAQEINIDEDYLYELQTMEYKIHSLNFEDDKKDGHTTELGEIVSDPLVPSVEDIVIAADEKSDPFAADIRKILAESALTALEQEVLWMRFAEGSDIHAVAQFVELPVKTVSEISRQAKVKLRREMKKLGGFAHFMNLKSEAEKDDE